MILVGLRATDWTTPMEPSSARLLVHARPAPGLAGDIVNAEPFASGWLKTVNLSPAAKGWATLRLFIVNMPVPVLFSVPLTATELLLVASDLSTLMNRLPASVRLLLIVKAPTAL